MGMILFDGAKKSQYLYEEASDLDLSSLYPSIIITYNLSRETLIKKLNIKKYNPIEGVYNSIEDEFIDDYIGKDYVYMGSKYLGLPTVSGLIKEMM